MDFASLPHRFGDRAAIGDLRSAEDRLEPEQAGDRSWRVAGRVLGRRGQGGVTFIDLEDVSGRVADYVDPSTATAADIVNALIAAKLMKAS